MSKPLHKRRPAETAAVGGGVLAAAATAIARGDYLGVALILAVAVLPALVTYLKVRAEKAQP